MKRLGVFLLPLDGMPVHRRVTPGNKFAGTHLYTWVERGTVRVKCLAQEHNTMSPARTRTRTTRSGDWTNTFIIYIYIYIYMFCIPQLSPCHGHTMAIFTSALYYLYIIVELWQINGAKVELKENANSCIWHSLDILCSQIFHARVQLYIVINVNVDQRLESEKKNHK